MSNMVRRNTRWSTRRHCALLSSALAFALALDPGTAWAQGKNGPPIKVGAISSLTTAAAFPDSARAVKAYFDVINAEGGVHGRKLVLIAEDDKGDPKVARDAARRLAEREDVVAHVGSASTMECSVNAEYYASRGLISIQGTGVDPACFGSPNVSPVNTGPYVGLWAALYFASDVLKRQKLCSVLMDIPGMGPGYEEAVASWKKHTRRSLTLHDPLYPPGAPAGPFIKKVLDAGCEAVVFLGLEPWVIDWVKAARDVKGIDWIFLTPAYTADVAKTLGADGEGIYAMSEFMPWSSRSLDLTDWRDTMKRGKVPLTSFSQGGYLAAQVFVSTLRGMRGEITRESVQRAFREFKGFDSPLIGTQYNFGAGAKHSSNRAIIPMVLRDGQWRVAHADWVIVPQF
jgi:branched-chain amino acid transport system substrate-binding protein